MSIFTTVISTTIAYHKHYIIAAMFILETIVSLVAPHNCMICGAEGDVICVWCLPDFTEPLPECCYKCKKQFSGSLVCQKCRRTSRLKHVWVRSSYGSKVKQLIHDFKFERKQAAAKPIAQLLSETVPYLSRDVIVTHIPTATSRIRQRGYDHAALIAKALASELGLPYQHLLVRTTQTRQVRSARAVRLKQLDGAFKVIKPETVRKSHILLIDDIVTTGGTIEAAAKTLRLAGAKTIDGAVFAQKQ